MMQDKEQQSRLQQFLTLSDKMLVCARNEQWDEVMDIQPKRDQLMHDFFSDEPDLKDNRLVVAIQRIQGSDQEVIRLGETFRESLKQEMKKMNWGKSAVKAYTSA